MSGEFDTKAAEGPVPATPGVLLVVSGPSGAGKDTVIESLRSYEPGLQYCVSVTTRPPRPYERDGVHYHFTTRDNFEKMAAAGEFIETREYAGNLYGTPRRTVDEALAQGRDLILKPEVNGARAIKAQYPGAVLVFLTPPSTAELERRLARRQADSPEAIEERLRIAREELAALTDFDYRVVNDTLAGAVSDLRAILTAERLKVARLAGRMGLTQETGKPV
jgi:guanylate kinase